VTGDAAGAPVVTLRDLTEGDLEWVAAQEQEIFGAGAWSPALLREDFRYGNKRYRGVEVDGVLAGWAIYGFDGDAFHLMNIAVAAGDRRAGLGRALMEDFLREAREVQAMSAWLEVAVTNVAAIALYREYGFTDVRMRRRYYQPGDIDAVVMKRSLGGSANASQELEG
jgi:ribosomal-protein-alanine N-acetyltransferase